MWKDPIIEEIRQVRKEYAASLSNDPDKIFEDIKKKQTKSGKKLVKLPPRIRSRPRSGSRILELTTLTCKQAGDTQEALGYLLLMLTGVRCGSCSLGRRPSKGRRNFSL